MLRCVWIETMFPETSLMHPTIDRTKHIEVPVCRPATPQEYGYFLQWVLDSKHNTEHISKDLDLTIDQFCCLFWTAGQVYSICVGGEVHGFYWVEVRGNLLHLRGIGLKEDVRGHDLELHVLRQIQNQYDDQINLNGLDFYSYKVETSKINQYVSPAWLFGQGNYVKNALEKSTCF